jgi:inosose dehydratase
MGSDSNSGLVGRPSYARLAGAPISWGVCEIPGWGRILPPDRVLGEMASVGLHATELGPLGYLPLEPELLRAQLARFGLGLVGAFVPLPLVDAVAARAAEAIRNTAENLASAGAEVFVVALVMDHEWSRPVPLDDAGWRRVADGLAEADELVSELGMTLALHPHVGTLIETTIDVQRALAATDVGWCLDTGHLLIGGVEPAEFIRDHAERVVHVHLKDVDLDLASGVRAGELQLLDAVKRGLFRPLGQGDAGIAEVIGLLDERGYDGWLVLEQDTAITGDEPPVGSGPMLDVIESLAFLHKTAGTTGEVHQ